MKVIAFTDTHGNSKKMLHLEGLIKKVKPDLLLCGGDITWFGEHIDLIAKKLNSFNIPLLIIPGNHETEEEIKHISKRFKNIINIHKGLYETNGYQFFGYGSGGFSQLDPGLEKLIIKIKKDIKDPKRFVVISHGPPYKTNCDDIGENVGSRSLRRFIEALNPCLVVCGHIHECEHTEDKIKNSRIINPGDGEIITL